MTGDTRWSVTQVRKALLLVAVVVLLAGCRIDSRVEVTLHDDGSGVLSTTVQFDSDAVSRLGGAAALQRTVPLDDLRTAGWTISPWSRGTGGSSVVTLSHPFVDGADLTRRVTELAGPHGILQSPKITHDRGWFSSQNGLSIVVDVRSPQVDIVHDKPLAAKLRGAGIDPATLEAQLEVQLRSALHVTVVAHLPGPHSKAYVATPGSVGTFQFAQGGTDWDHVVKFGIGIALALLAGSFLLAAGMGARRNRRRASQRIEGHPEPDIERAPLM